MILWKTVEIVTMPFRGLFFTKAVSFMVFILKRLSGSLKLSSKGPLVSAGLSWKSARKAREARNASPHHYNDIFEMKCCKNRKY